jgi:hypothetical protein
MGNLICYWVLGFVAIHGLTSYAQLLIIL